MSIRLPGTEQEPDLRELEEQAAEHLAKEGLAPLEAEEFLEEEAGISPLPIGRVAFVVSCSTLAAAVMVGGVFLGLGPRIWAAVAGLLGVGLAVLSRRLRNPIMVNVAIVVGIVLVGIILAIPGGSLADVFNLAPFVREAVTSGDVLRPPVEFTLGWRAILGWLMGGLGLAAAWVGIELRRPALGLLVPLPIVAIAAISVSNDAKLASGLFCLVLFAVGLGLLSGIETGGDGEQRPLSYEVRRGARALPMIAVITGGLFFLARANFLFPPPLFDPTQSAQKPRTVPLTEVPDRVLFTVKASITGPWRMGGLDVYDGKDWRLAPFAQNLLREVPRSGVVDSELQPGVRATFDIKDLGGAVLPGLPNLVGVVAEGPSLAYDRRTGNIRLAQGQIQPGLRYTAVAARVPSVEELRNITASPPNSVERYLEIPPPPPAVRDLLQRAPETPPWDRFDFVRQEFLKIVIAKGQGVPVSMPPEKVDDLLAGSKRGTPYEIVAAQAMLARWVGIPARIGYGFDGGEPAGDVVEVRPKHGVSFVEVYFAGYKWLPVIGTPLQAETSFGTEQTQQNRDVLASDDIAVRVFVPFEVDPKSYLFQQIRAIVSIVVPVILAMLIAYYIWPGLRKVILRTRRRSWAQRRGIRERIAVGYSEWRDLATDFGYRFESDTPLMFLDRVVPDEEHVEFSWLVTRGLWGDLQDRLGPDDATAAEELSRTLRRRMSQAHSWTLRTIAAVSRLSLRYPYDPLIDTLRKEKKSAIKKAA